MTKALPNGYQFLIGNLDTLPRKTIGPKTYIHVSSLKKLDASARNLISKGEVAIGLIPDEHYNVLRFDTTNGKIGFLSYPEFFDAPFPRLNKSWLFNTTDHTWVYRTYEDSLNPPVLHRKELLLPDNHPRQSEYKALSEEAEAIGLFDELSRIGYERQWYALINEKGYSLVGSQFVPIGNDVSVDGSHAPLSGDWLSARQSTALARTGLSAPIQTLSRYNFLDGAHSLFDYGSGRGDDVKRLVEMGVDVSGWDPFYNTASGLRTADIVNLGFVINVIEDFGERQHALINAFSLARKILVVAVMLHNSSRPAGRKFGDGILTARGTFQKYYSQAEFKAFVEATLHEEAVPVAPGIVYVFRDKVDEQRFINKRHTSRRALVTTYLPKRIPRSTKSDSQYALYRDSLDALWERWLSLGRMPDPDEVSDLEVLNTGFGSLARALKFVKRLKDDGLALPKAERRRKADIEVQLALQLFEQRDIVLKNLEPCLRRDVKALFGTLSAARSRVESLLYCIANVEEIDRACRDAADHGLGWYVPGESLQLHVSMVEQLQPLLRIYVSCASVVYGDHTEADLLKLHVKSAKISLMKFDNFDSSPLPRMLERVKIKLREQDIEYYAYRDNYEPPYLYYKSRYINEEHSSYSEQLAFDKTLEQLALVETTSYGPAPGEFLSRLANRRYEVRGFSLVRSKSVPELDETCGKFLTYRQLVECGETQIRTQCPNAPKTPDTYTALNDLATEILDPVIDYFGMVRLTFGFCSPQLSRKISSHIAPKLDQHASHEVNSRGKQVCSRLGAAVDFIVNDEDMLEVAQWIVSNLPFDRLYFYGRDRPLHVSYGPNQDRKIVLMTATDDGRLIPRVISVGKFARMSSPLETGRT